MKEKTYIAIDLKSFYASVECVERGLNPLTTNLVVADASRTSKTICLAVTPALKKYGLSGRSRLFEVEQKVKEIKQSTGREIEYITAVPRMALYIKYSAFIYSIYLKYVSPEDIHVYSIDEVFMDVTHYLSLYQMSAKELAKKIVLDVYRSTGITATVGLGTNLYLCKIAMDIGAKHILPDEDGVRIAELDEMTFREKMWDHQPLTDFWRTGAGITKKLAQHGMYTMGDVARVSLQNEDWLYKIFGIDAEILIDHAWGYEPCTIADIKAYRPKSNSLGSGQVLQEPYQNEKARIVVREMTELLVLNLVDKDLVTESLTLHIGYDRINVDEGNYSREIKTDYYGRTVPKPAHGTANLGAPSSSTSEIVEAVLQLFDQITDPSLYIRRINLSANNVMPRGFEQLNIFSNPEQLEKERKMQKAMLAIHRRFGKNAILKGTNLEEGATTVERNQQIGGHKA
ncbi:MAG: DNA methylase [Eubacterium sp.]|nr:DNA methylase [Eubacterium sp.]